MKNINWLKIINFYFFQWFFVRLAKIVDDNNNIIRWTWVTCVYPLTGWSNFIKEYKFTGKKYLKYIKFIFIMLCFYFGLFFEYAIYFTPIIILFTMWFFHHLSKYGDE